MWLACYADGLVSCPCRPLGQGGRQPWHLPGSGTFVARPLRQGQSSALVVADGRRSDPLGRPALGIAVPEGAGTVRALERRSWATPQEADRLGAPGDPAGEALAGETARDHCRRLQLRRTGSDGGGAAARLPGDASLFAPAPVRRPGQLAGLSDSSPRLSAKPHEMRKVELR